LADEKNNKNEDSEFEIESVNDGGSEASPASIANADAILALQAELDRAKKDYLYLRADFDNYKKSVIKERSDLLKYGSERVFRELLDVLDTFERALQTELTAESIQNYKEGISLTATELLKTLSRFGVTELPCEGLPFDPNVHEALSSEETDATAPGNITRVFKKAYKLHDRVIRPAQVVVAKAPNKN
jgi:molecular chaperone GrpE